MSFNLSFLDTANNYVDILQGVNSMSGNLLVPVIISLFFLIVLVATSARQVDITNSLIASVFVAIFITLIFWGLDMLDPSLLIIPIIIISGAIMFKLISKQ
ncbi:hypothetical protein ES702_02748 [subsurface metagenome]